jgi:transglutaminase-like putative cysteine protease
MSDVRNCSIQTTQVRFGYAWAEIYFDGAGWVPFEPTPGRGPGQDSVSG